MRMSLNLKQYNRLKSAKYGMLFRSIISARFPYTFTAAVNAGTPKQHNSDFCKYYVHGTEKTILKLWSQTWKGVLILLEGI